MRVLRIALLAAAAAGCAHEAVFTSSLPGGPKAPRDSGVFHRVTYAGADGFPAWLPDGAALIYSFASNESPPLHLRCLGMIPPEGGTRTALPCKVRAASDTIDASDWPVAGPADALVYSWVMWRAGAYVPDSVLVLLGSTATTNNVVPAFKFPATLGQRLFSQATHFAWLDANTIVAAGEVATIVQDCPSCPIRTVYAGRNLLQFDLTTQPATVTLVPNTAQATSVSAGASGEIYYTLAGDSRVFRETLATGDTSLVHDFAPGGVTRDVQVVGNRLVAIVGGNITVATDPVVGVFQTDSGGLIHVLDLTTGADSVLPDSGYLFRHPGLSPNADRVAAEAWRGGLVDLWVFHLP